MAIIIIQQQTLARLGVDVGSGFILVPDDLSRPSQ